MTNELCSGLQPVVPETAKVIILGSIPGKISLNEQEYYAHPRNAFWYIISRYFGLAIPTTYPEKVKLVKTHNILLWDVVQSCHRKGSLDSNIDTNSIITNDFERYFRQHETITAVLFNGAKAEKEYMRSVLSTLSDKFRNIELVRLPSTSPALASMTKEEKYNIWCDVLSNYL
jgi:TDG/mug DNA glycosylase family protein